MILDRSLRPDYLSDEMIRTPSAREHDRNWLDAQVKAFEARGGKITQCGFGESGEEGGTISEIERVITLLNAGYAEVEIAKRINRNLMATKKIIAKAKGIITARKGCKASAVKRRKSETAA